MDYWARRIIVSYKMLFDFRSFIVWSVVTFVGFCIVCPHLISAVSGAILLIRATAMVSLFNTGCTAADKVNET